MAFSAKLVFQGALTTTTTTTLYTNPGSVTTIIKDIIICNTGASTRAVTIATNGSAAGNRIFNATPLAPNETLHWEGHTIVTTGLTITGGQDAGTDVTVTISAVEGT